MAEQLKYNGNYSFSKPTIFGYGHECYYCSMNENSRHLHQKLMPAFLNTHIKWWNVVPKTLYTSVVISYAVYFQV